MIEFSFTSLFGTILDLGTILASAVAAWLWYRASIVQISRVSAEETFDHRDINRVIVSMNRSGIRNRRGALASAIAAAMLALDLGFTQFPI